VDAEATPQSIGDALATARSHAFRTSLAGMTNPYGDGFAAERITDVLTRVPLTASLLLKRHDATPTP
jgi:UDP-N-acetylglucosamine 2-epimerase (non-hydrolysing)/GDP/UDP-N,N'-diacetylbacillosamine 2-epimerase (hydrolysing)